MRCHLRLPAVGRGAALLRCIILLVESVARDPTEEVVEEQHLWRKLLGIRGAVSAADSTETGLRTKPLRVEVADQTDRSRFKSKVVQQDPGPGSPARGRTNQPRVAGASVRWSTVAPMTGVAP
ncbi:hypothetical protein MSTO_58590 [Mycobacterium stomatepiae]|uniref:Uncharacterized protein n=1 Tax=Mycobacterium stomatepiae TaxID=470076 RepID=A0A7I7QH43_9MYCO|nr:hypothetical protein MSTO_58590 [Mycobacterium stomatepiae]